MGAWSHAVARKRLRWFVSRWINLALALGLLGGCAEGRDATPERREHQRPKIPARIPLDDEQCRSCDMTEAGVCKLFYRVSCGEATCGQEVPCDPECCVQNGRAKAW